MLDNPQVKSAIRWAIMIALTWAARKGVPLPVSPEAADTITAFALLVVPVVLAIFGIRQAREQETMAQAALTIQPEVAERQGLIKTEKVDAGVKVAAAITLDALARGKLKQHPGIVDELRTILKRV